MNWISCKEKKIPDYWVFSFHIERGRIIAKQVENRLVEELCCCMPRNYHTIEEFTHWMPLPEPPKEK